MIQNQKGQGMIEFTLIIPMALLFLIYVVQVLLYLTVEIAVDDAMESYALCEVQAKENCKSLFEKEIGYLPLQKTHFKFSKQGIDYKIDLEAQALRIFQLKKTRLIAYETKI